jgi:hypothetical protein
VMLAVEYVRHAENFIPSGLVLEHGAVM